jgi:DnaK suppressor protein
MIPADQNKYKKYLEEALHEVRKYLESSEDAAAAVAPDKGLGRLSRMEAMQDQQLVMEMRRRKKRQLVEIKLAISRLEMGNYGTCVFCGKEISPERLEVAPEVQTCMSCS